MVGVLRAYGHSWVYGAAASRPENGFAARTAEELALNLDNRAESATVSAQTEQAVARVTPHPAAAFVLMAGLNDARLYGKSAADRRAYAETLEKVLTALSARPGVPVVAVAQPHLIDYSGYEPFDKGSNAAVDAYNSTLSDVVAQYDCARVAVVRGWDPATMIAPDGVHPNDRGHAQLSLAVIRAVRCAA